MEGLWLPGDCGSVVENLNQETFPVTASFSLSSTFHLITSKSLLFLLHEVDKIRVKGTKAILTEEDISVQASALGRTRTNVDRENLSFGNLTAWDVDN